MAWYDDWYDAYDPVAAAYDTDLLAGYDWMDTLAPVETFGLQDIADVYGDMLQAPEVPDLSATSLADALAPALPEVPDLSATSLADALAPELPVAAPGASRQGQPSIPTPGGGEKSVVTKALDWIKQNPGKVAQAALGLGSVASIGAGLAQRVPKVKVPERPTAPQERAAQQAMMAAREAVSRPIAERGYAGEEAIRQRVNQQLVDMLEGRSETASPALVRSLQDKRRELEDRLRYELGPGYAISTAGRNALDNFERMAQELLEQDRERKLQSRNAMGLQRSTFARTLELDPFTLARLELGTLAALGSQDAALRLRADLANQARAGANRRALLATGGQLGGMALGPLLYQAILDSVRRRA